MYVNYKTAIPRVRERRFEVHLLFYVAYTILERQKSSQLNIYKIETNYFV